ncbi:hypothetical protein SNE510_73190 [Streptomyces sp. NE5-10]|uniref:thiol-disulfide oxidoreductase DCC family protein n=1 Tax=Streptomyces sp. NE5-10 TaxID=2759674 RepID=UPI001A4E93F1|nr:DCC1-like thiol-disulfide oxidoreductase family protein [Streptomyces sp. NE5-10]GHJ97800.1 hypothetical protein SNE510_73190 [Streptomyces sp. NE5-10]
MRPRCEIVPWWRCTNLDALGVTPERAAYEVLWVTPSGAVDGGARTVAKALLSAGGVWAPLGAVLLLPGVRWVARGVYPLVAAHRTPAAGRKSCLRRAPPLQVTGPVVSAHQGADGWQTRRLASPGHAPARPRPLTGRAQEEQGLSERLRPLEVAGQWGGVASFRGARAGRGRQSVR